MIACTLTAILTIRLNAIVTGIFLAVELIALFIVMGLGFAHAHNGHYLVSPHLFLPNGHAIAASAAVIGAGIAIAIFSYNGYNAPINLAEETAGSAKNIAKAVYLTFALTIVGELVPITATLLGAPSLGRLTNAPTPMTYFLKATGGHAVEVGVGIGIFLAGINATLAVILWFARLVYSSGRDRGWPGAVSDWMALVHPKFNSPWVATLFVGTLGTFLTFFSNIALLVTFTGVVLVIDYGLIAICAIVSRITQKDLPRPHKMPLWPLPALVGLAGTAYAATKQTGHDLIIVGSILAAGAVYYFVYLFPRRKTRWVMLQAPRSEEHEETALGAVAEEKGS
jgi:amino acid transporter